MHLPEDVLVSLRVRSNASADPIQALAAACPPGVQIDEICVVEQNGAGSLQDVLHGHPDLVHAFLDEVTALDGIQLLNTSDVVLEAHRGGKITVVSRIPLRSLDDLRIIYTPGVARVVSRIHENPRLVWEFTGMGNTVGIYTNGSRVLSLGDVGPLASLPVMEGKAVLYRELAGLSAVPILVDCPEPSHCSIDVDRGRPHHRLSRGRRRPSAFGVVAGGASRRC